MNRMKMKKIAFLFFALLATESTYAQGGVGLHFSLGFPYGDFKENTDAVGFGGNLDVLFPMQAETPLTFGFNIGYQVYGLNTQFERLTAQISVGSTVIDEIVIPLKIVTTNSIFGMHAMTRLKAPIPFIQPYIQGLAGFRYISTSTRIVDESEDHRYSSEDNRVIVRKTQLGDYILSYGGGAGVQIEISRRASIDFNVTYLNGHEAKYYDGEDTSKWKISFKGSEEEWIDGGKTSGEDFAIDASPKKSETDMLNFQLGIFFTF